MAEAENTFMRKAMLRASELGARIFRNNVAIAWVGQVIKQSPGTITLKNPRVLHAGLCVGSSDLIGWVPVVVTPDMVGRTVGVFVAIETKRVGEKATADQEKFIYAVNRSGGLAGVASIPEHIDNLLARYASEPTTD